MHPESLVLVEPTEEPVSQPTQPGEWECTDPDSLQFRRFLRDQVWEFKEFERLTNTKEFSRFKAGYDRNPETFYSKPHYWDAWQFWNTGEIDLAQESPSSIEDTLSSYYDEEEVKRLMESTDPDDQGIVAECVWEMSSGMY